MLVPVPRARARRRRSAGAGHGAENNHRTALVRVGVGVGGPLQRRPPLTRETGRSGSDRWSMRRPRLQGQAQLVHRQVELEPAWAGCLAAAGIGPARRLSLPVGRLLPGGEG